MEAKAMTKRILSGIFILIALGALGLILAGALTSGEQLIVRFLTAIIVAALGLYVISDLRMQATDDAAATANHSITRSRDAGPAGEATAPLPSNTAAFMATVTGKKHTNPAGQPVVGDAPIPAPSAAAGEPTMQLLTRTSSGSGIGASGANSVEEASTATGGGRDVFGFGDSASATGTFRLDPSPTSTPPAPFAGAILQDEDSPAPYLEDEEIASWPHKPGTGSTPAVTGGIVTEPDAGKEPDLPASDDEAQVGAAPAGASVSDAATEPPASREPETDTTDAGLDVPDSTSTNLEAGLGADSSTTEPEGSGIETDVDDSAEIDELVARFARKTERDLEVRQSRAGSPGQAPAGDLPAPEAAPSGNVADEVCNDDPAPAGPDSSQAAPTASEPPGWEEFGRGDLSSDDDRDGDDVGSDVPVTAAGGAGSGADITFEPAEAMAEPHLTGNTDAGGTTSTSTSTEAESHTTPADTTTITNTTATTASGSAANAESGTTITDAGASVAAEPTSGTELHLSLAAVSLDEGAGDPPDEAPVQEPTPLPMGNDLEAAAYAHTPIAPIINLHGVRAASGVEDIEAAICSGELEVISSLIEQGLLSTEGPISDRDVRTMVYVAFTSNELRKILLAGGVIGGDNSDLDLGEIEVFQPAVTPSPVAVLDPAPRSGIEALQTEDDYETPRSHAL
jgi:hypothetical protein